MNWFSAIQEMRARATVRANIRTTGATTALQVRAESPAKLR
jgi:hypothetical protein